MYFNQPYLAYNKRSFILEHTLNIYLRGTKWPSLQYFLVLDLYFLDPLGSRIDLLFLSHISLAIMISKFKRNTIPTKYIPIKTAIIVCIRNTKLFPRCYEIRHQMPLLSAKGSLIDGTSYHLFFSSVNEQSWVNIFR